MLSLKCMKNDEGQMAKQSASRAALGWHLAAKAAAS